MGDATEKYELEDGPADSQQPLTVGYEKDGYEVKSSVKDSKKDILSFCLAVFNLMNAILGSGILGLAEAMKNLGVVLFYILLLMTAGLAGYTINLLLKASKITDVKSYEGLAVKAYGKAGQIATSVMIIFHCFGAMCSYVYIIKAEMPEVVNALVGNVNSTISGGHHSADDPWYLQGTFLMIIVVALVIVPLASMKDIRFLGYSSAFGMTCMLMFTFTVVAKKFSIPCPLSKHSNDSHFNHSFEGDQTCKADIVVINKKSAFAVPTMMFAFMCHASMLPIYSELRRPSPKKMKQVAGVSIFLVLALYLLSASFGYFTFYNYVQSELLLSYSLYEPTDKLIIASRIMVLICVTLSTPLLHYPCRKTIIVTFMKKYEKEFSWVVHLGLMFVLLTMAVILVAFIPNIRDIFGIAGATSSTSLLIIFPGAFYLRIVKPRPGKDNRVQRIVVTVLIVIGIVFMLTSVALIILSWVNP